MNTCATCRWWQEGELQEDWLGDEALVGYATMRVGVRNRHGELVQPQPFEVRVCACPKLRENERPERDGMTAIDASEYHAHLVTGPDFGCIHWLAEPPQPAAEE